MWSLKAAYVGLCLCVHSHVPYDWLSLPSVFVCDGGPCCCRQSLNIPGIGGGPLTDPAAWSWVPVTASCRHTECQGYSCLLPHWVQGFLLGRHPSWATPHLSCTDFLFGLVFVLFSYPSFFFKDSGCDTVCYFGALGICNPHPSALTTPTDSGL